MKKQETVNKKLKTEKKKEKSNIQFSYGKHGNIRHDKVDLDSVSTLSRNKKIRKINFNLLFFVGTGILIIGGIAGSIYFLSKIPKKAEEIAKMRTQNLSYSMNSQDEMLLNQNLKETEEKRLKIGNVFPDENDFLNFIKIVDEIKKSGIEVERFTVDSDIPTKIGKGQSLLPITLSLSGKEEEIVKALDKIIESKYLIRVVGFSKEFINSEEEQVTITVSFHLHVSDEFSKVKS